MDNSRSSNDWQRRPRFAPVFLIGLAATLFCATASASLMNVASPTTSWTTIRYGGVNGFDPTVDQQTGSSEGDIVGNATHGSVYTFFADRNTPSTTDGDLGFRLRLGADANPAGFQYAAFVGIITNRASGKIDLFIGVNNSGQANQVGIWAPGSGLNVSPSTTTIVSPALVSYAPTASNYHFTAVTSTMDPTATNFDIDGGGQNDFFLTFSIPFSDIVAQLAARGITGITEESSFSYVIATSTQGNSLNQDLNGVTGGVNSSQTWAQLGGLSDPTIPIAAVPEINVTASVALLLLAVFAHRRLVARRAREDAAAL
jgi:hypothetical protein